MTRLFPHTPHGVRLPLTAAQTAHATHATHATPVGTWRTRSRLALRWSLRLLLATAFLLVGTRKLLGTADMVLLFTQIGAGQWLRGLTGALEVTGAVLLLFPRWTRVGALVLATVLIGAVAVHLGVLGRSPAPPLVLLALVALLAWARGTPADGPTWARTPSD